MLYIYWLIFSVAVWIYSYGFVDLNLTLSSHPLVFHFISYLQHLVYFDRSLSLQIFIGLILVAFGLYLYTLKTVTSFPWRLVVTVSIILALAYPMLSSDVFKYLFSAKEILVYHANPYLVTPNAFPDDTWIRFMRWVHTTTPYGPLFTGLTIPYYLLGMGKFVPILYLFKIDQVAWYLLAIWLIGKLKGVKAQIFFAFNPLILIEWLVNAHNDALMITLLLLSLYLLTLKRKIWSYVALLASVGIKYITIIFVPVLLFPKLLKNHFQSTICWLIALLTLAPLLYHYSWQYQPWYVTWIIPFAGLVDSKLIKWTVATYSFSVISRYLYFVGTGSWLGTPLEHLLMTFLPPVIVAIMILCNGFLSSKKSSG